MIDRWRLLKLFKSVSQLWKELLANVTNLKIFDPLVSIIGQNTNYEFSRFPGKLFSFRENLGITGCPGNPPLR